MKKFKGILGEEMAETKVLNRIKASDEYFFVSMALNGTEGCFIIIIAIP